MIINESLRVCFRAEKSTGSKFIRFMNTPILEFYIFLGDNKIHNWTTLLCGNDCFLTESCTLMFPNVAICQQHMCHTARRLAWWSGTNPDFVLPTTRPGVKIPLRVTCGLGRGVSTWEGTKYNGSHFWMKISFKTSNDIAFFFLLFLSEYSPFGQKYKTLLSQLL